MKLKKIFITIVIFVISLLNLNSISAKAVTNTNNPILKGSDSRSVDGSNYWNSCNLREWLNSDDITVHYTNQKPSSDKLGDYAYDKESGFLNEFSKEEVNAIAVTTHRVPISDTDSKYKDGGIDTIPSNLTPRDSVTYSMAGLESEWQDYFYQDINDKVYLLSPHELYLFIQKRGNTINRSVTNAVQSKYKYSDDNIDWFLHGGAENIGYEIAYKSEVKRAISTTEPCVPLGIVPIINLKPNYQCLNGEYVKDLKIGEDIVFGKHLDEAINWKVVNKQDGYAMLVANYAVDIKSMDAPGDGAYAYSKYIDFKETAIDRTNPIYAPKNNNSDINPPVFTVLNSDQLGIRQNGSFTVSLKITDETSVKPIKLPDGNWTTSTEFNYTIFNNGEYMFIASDENDNYRYFIIPVANVNVPPNVNITASNYNWTNKNVDVTIKASNDVGLNVPKQVLNSRDVGFDTWTNYTSYMNKRIHITGDVEFVKATKSTSDINASVAVSYYYRNMSDTEYVIKPNWYIINDISLDDLKNNGKQHIDTILTVPSNYFEDLTPFFHMNIQGYEKSYTIKWTNMKYELMDKDDFAITKIILPTGREINGSSYIDTLTKKGVYYYKVLDNRGMITEKNIEVLIDKDKPNINISNNPTSYTNKDVQLRISASDSLSGFSYMKLPNGIKTTDSNTVFNISSNGYYKFTVVDNAGNIKEKTININKIDKIAPILILTANTTDWTHDDVIINVETSDNLSGVKEIGLPNENYVYNNKSIYTTSINGIYTFSIKDNAGNTSTKSFSISNIDKTLPTPPNIFNNQNWTNNNVLVTIADGTDNESGIKETQYFLEGATNTNWTKYSTPLELNNEGITTIKSRTINNAGLYSNEANSETKIDKVKPDNDTIKITISK